MFEPQEPIPKSEPSQTVQLPLVNVSYVTLAARMGVKPDTLERWVRAGKIIQPVWFGNRARWTEAQAARIISEGTQPAGTYPPHNSPRAKQLAALPKNVTKSIKTHLGKKSDRMPLAAPKRTPSKRKGGGR